MDAGYIVILDKDLDDSESQKLIAAIKQLRGVLEVQPVTADNHLAFAEQRALERLRKQLRDILFPVREY